MRRRGIVNVDHEKAGLHARHVHREDAARRDAEVAARVHQPVPYRQRPLRIHPDFEAEIAGVAGARDADRNVADAGVRQAKILELVERLCAAAVEHRARLWTLQAQGRHPVGDFGDFHVEPDRVHREPAQRRFGRGHAKAVLVQLGDRAVVKHLPVVVAPAGVVDLAHLHFQDVARGDLVQQARGIRPLDQVLHQRRDVDQRRAIADRPIFVLERELVGTEHDVPGPTPPVLRHAQARGALVKRRAFEFESFKH